MPPRSRRSLQRTILIGAAGVAGAALHAAPTGVLLLDVAWSAAYALALAYCGAWCSPLFLLVAGAVAAMCNSSGLGLGLAAASVAVSAATSAQARPSSRRSAVAGGLLALAVLQQGEGWAGTVIGGGVLATVVVLSSAWQGMGRRRRLRAGLIAGGLVALLAVGSAAGLLAGLKARGDAQDGIDALRAARAAATSGDVEGAVQGFRTAERAFHDAVAPLHGYGRLGRLVPGLSAQLEAATVGVETAGDVSTALRRAGRSLRLDDVGLRSGAVDLAAVRAAEPALATARAAIDGAVRRLSALDPDGLVPPARHALEDAVGEARAASGTAGRAHRAIQVLPDVLGGTAPTRYLVLFTSPVEARNRFGFPGAFAILRFDGGRATIEATGDNNDLDRSATKIDQGKLLLPARALPYQGYGATRSWRATTMVADGPSLTELAVQMGALSGLGHLDGVVLADTKALAAIIGLVGDVPVPGTGVTLNARNTADFLERRQYLEFPDIAKAGVRKDKLVEVADTVGRRIGTLSVPSLQDLATRFGPLVAEGHLVVSVPEQERPEAAGLLHELLLDGALDKPEHADLLYVGQRNRVGNKVDLFLRRALSYEVEVAEDGAVTAQLEVELTNSAPPGGLPEYVIGSALLPADRPPAGTNLTTTLLYTPYEVRSLEVDGVPVTPSVLIDGGILVYEVEVALGPGEHHTISATLGGRAAGAPYALRYLPGNLVQPDALSVAIHDRRDGRKASGTLAQVTAPACLGTGSTPTCRG